MTSSGVCAVTIHGVQWCVDDTYSSVSLSRPMRPLESIVVILFFSRCLQVPACITAHNQPSNTPYIVQTPHAALCTAMSIHLRCTYAVMDQRR